MKKHPYANAPDYRLWRRAVSETAPADVDPVSPPPFRISRAEKVVTAGSCFAQHIARRLRDGGFTFHVTETAHPILPPHVAEAFHYGVFPARYGNLYTARQLLQLLRRAYGTFQPEEDVWEEAGRFFDPFRPQIQPNGFASRLEYDLDRRQHLAAVRRAFEEMDVFIFTLGLTESWAARADGAIFPVCPGTAAGTFDAAKYEFLNFTAEEVAADLNSFVDELAQVNSRARIILTVSPVPLVATAEDRHVLVSTTYSKSALRVAAETLVRQGRAYYFPSYEIITGAHARGGYFAHDVRSVTETGVDQVMRLFFRHVTDSPPAEAPAPVSAPEPDPFLAQTKAIVDALCDEERLDAGLAKGR